MGPIILLCTRSCAVWLKGEMKKGTGKNVKYKHVKLDLNWAMPAWQMCPWVTALAWSIGGYRWVTRACLPHMVYRISCPSRSNLVVLDVGCQWLEFNPNISLLKDSQDDLHGWDTKAWVTPEDLDWGMCSSLLIFTKWGQCVWGAAAPL